MRLHYFAYRYADAVLAHKAFGKAKQEIERTLRQASVPLLAPTKGPGAGGVKRRKRKPLKGGPGPRYMYFPVDQKALNSQLDKAFEAVGWHPQPPIVSAARTGGPETGLKADYKKGRVQIEVQLGNMARWYTDVFKFQLSYSLGEIDAAVLVVPTQGLANMIDENVAYYERVLRDLPWAKMSLTLPILVMGVEPDDWKPIQA